MIKHKQYFITFMAFFIYINAYADPNCDLDHLSTDHNKLSKEGQTAWLEVIRPAASGELNKGNPCEFNLNISNPNSDDEHAYFLGKHTGFNQRDHFQYKFSLKELNTTLSHLKPGQEMTFFEVANRSSAGDDTYVRTTISEGQPGFWKIKLFWNPVPLNSAFETINIPKVINNHCHCAEIIFHWERMPHSRIQFKFSMTIHNAHRQKVLFATRMPNITKLGYISSDHELGTGNTMHFGTIKNSEPDASQ